MGVQLLTDAYCYLIYTTKKGWTLLKLFKEIGVTMISKL